MLSLLTNPLIILAGGGFLLLTGSFIYREKKSDPSKNHSHEKGNVTSGKESDRTVKDTGIMNPNERTETSEENIRVSSQFQRLEILERRLEEKEKRLNALLKAAENTADRLSRMIARFEKTFYSPETKTKVVSGMMAGLKDEIRGQLNEWEQSFQNETSLLNPDDLPQKFSTLSPSGTSQPEGHPQFRFEPFPINPVNSVELTDSVRSVAPNRSGEFSDHENKDRNFKSGNASGSPARHDDLLNEKKNFENRQQDVHSDHGQLDSKHLVEDYSDDDAFDAEIMKCVAGQPNRSGLELKMSARTEQVNAERADSESLYQKESDSQGFGSGLSRIEKSKAIRRLLKQKKSKEEIAGELGLDLFEVEIIVNTLNGQWKAA